MEIKNKVNIHNRFDIEVRDAVTGELKNSAVAYNIVLNQMYTRLCGGSTYFVNIHFGSGTGTLDPARTSLFSHRGTKAAVNDTLVKSIPVSSWKRKIVLNPEEFVGSTLSEVGVAFGAASTNLVTHSLLKDSDGSPISIVKTDTDVITIYATVFVTFDDSNPNLVYIGMPSGNALVNYLIGGGTAPTGAFSLNDLYLGVPKLGSTANATWTADTANKQRKTNVLRFGTNVGNGQVKFLEFANIFSLEFPYSPVFNGQSYEGASLGVGDGVVYEFNLSSVNIKDGSLVVKKNGVSTSDYTYEISKTLFRTVFPIEYVYAGNYNTVNSVSGDGKVIALCNSNSRLVHIYDVSDYGILLRNSIPITGGGYCNDVSLNYDGSVLLICKSTAPTFQVLKWDGVEWNAMPVQSGLSWVNNATYVTYSGSISSDGSMIVLARYAMFPYAVCLIWNGLSWNEGPAFPNFDIDVVSNIVLNKTVAFGALSVAYVFDLVGGVWVQRPNVGGSSTTWVCKLSLDGNVIMLGVYNSPYVRVYDWNGTKWVIRTNVGSPDSTFGGVLNQDGSRMMYVSSGSSNHMGLVEYVDSVWVQESIHKGLPTYQAIHLETDENFSVICASGPTYFYVYKANELYKIKFTTPPAIGDVITADYIVDGVHKTEQYVIDVSFAIQFGEVV